MGNPRTRSKKESLVSKVEFYMGRNDNCDIRAGGPPILSFWVYTSLPKPVIEKVAKDRYLQKVVRERGGDGSFKITEEWVEKFVRTRKSLKNNCLKLVKSFSS